MSEQEALVAAIRAEERAQAAHRRLDRMNGSIDRLGNEVSSARTEIGTKIDGVLLHLATVTGFEQARKQTWRDSQFWLSLIVAVVSSGATVAGLKLTS